MVLALLAMSGACGERHDRSPPQVDVIGDPAAMEEPLDDATQVPAQVFLGATAQGLVTFNANGDILGGLAERWIVEDGGQSYIFRLRTAEWPDGTPVKAATVARILKKRMAAVPQMMGGMEPQVRGMTDQVLEIRLPGPMPSFLQLLAQPALGIARASGGTGPFRATTKDDVVILEPADDPEQPEATEEEAEPNPDEQRIFLRTVRPALGFVRFQRDQSDLLLGGRFQHLPFTLVADLPERSIRADPVNGLFGLLIDSKADFLENIDTRELLSMAIDRERLAGMLNLAGWPIFTTILPVQLDLARPPTPVRWDQNDLKQRRGYARSVAANWVKRHGEIPAISIYLPKGPGARMLFRALAQDLRSIGVPLVRAKSRGKADLLLIDEVAPFESAIWYLSRVGCRFSDLCSEAAEESLKRARTARGTAERAAALAEAEVLTLEAANYIPLGSPIRFSLVDARLTGFQPSANARHPLNALLPPPK